MTNLTTRAVRPNAGIKNDYQRGLDALIEQMNTSVLYWTQASFNKRKDEVVAMDASPVVEFGKTLRKLGRYWSKKFADYAEKKAPSFAKRVNTNATNQLKSGIKTAGFNVGFKNTRHVNNIIQAIVHENVALIKSIPARFLSSVEAVVFEAVKNGRDMQAIAENVEKAYNTTKNRAKTIARDQTNKATEAISRARCEDIGIKHGIWMHRSGSKKPRGTHIEMDGKRFNISEGLYDSEEGRDVLPGELINCNCTYRLDLTSILDSAKEMQRG